MKKIIINTGYGILKNSEGNITDKLVLPLGEHWIEDSYSFEEVGDQNELDLIEVYKKPVDLEIEKEYMIEMKIIENSRKAAIDELKAEGKLESDYIDKKMNDLKKIKGNQETEIV